MSEIIPEPKFLLAASIPLEELVVQHCADELPSAAHLRALIHMSNYNVSGHLPWRLVVGWRTHEPVQIVPGLARSVSPITAGTSEMPSGDEAIFVQLLDAERFVDANSGRLLDDFDALLNAVSGYVLARAGGDSGSTKAADISAQA